MRNSSLSTLLLVIFSVVFAFIAIEIVVLPIYNEHFPNASAKFLAYFQIPLLSIVVLLLAAFGIFFKHFVKWL